MALFKECNPPSVKALKNYKLFPSLRFGDLLVVIGQGIGRKLHQMMLDWYFSTGKQFVWLGTAPNSRAEGFYLKSGWERNGMHGSKEVKFEMTKSTWENIRQEA